jgi:hypothetical protein
MHPILLLQPVRMDETDLKALYKYFHSLEPVENHVENTVYAPGEGLPKLK